MVIKRLLSFTTACSIVFLFPALLHAQLVLIKGELTDYATGKPLENASVRVKPKQGVLLPPANQQQRSTARQNDSIEW